MLEKARSSTGLRFHKIDRTGEFPKWAPREMLVRFFHETMKPYHDSVADIESGLDYALDPARSGFIMLVLDKEKLLGALTMLDSGMGGYIPRWLLLFVSVLPEVRGQGVGAELMRRSLDECDGPVKLHVEYDNPAKKLYERLGFSSKYAEMRWSPAK